MEIWILSAPRDFPEDFLPSSGFHRWFCAVTGPDWWCWVQVPVQVLGLREAGEGPAQQAIPAEDAGFLVTFQLSDTTLSLLASRSSWRALCSSCTQGESPQPGLWAGCSSTLDLLLHLCPDPVCRLHACKDLFSWLGW